jgi:hypothetical protein
MVKNPGTTPRANQLRSLNRPKAITMLTDQGIPVALVTTQGHKISVVQIQEEWRIDDEWWREPIDRHYYRLLLQNGHLSTVYHDAVEDAWYEQHY